MRRQLPDLRRKLLGHFRHARNVAGTAGKHALAVDENLDLQPCTARGVTRRELVTREVLDVQRELDDAIDLRGVDDAQTRGSLRELLARGADVAEEPEAEKETAGGRLQSPLLKRGKRRAPRSTMLHIMMAM